ncbi:tetratricopeptide repeat protein [Streptosporangium sp. NPDC051022]|uniref:ATP-binding protein n=1 Tax=Streptosporangium sp. NPDC051022 TaxID=3155752 RepID=UPI0034195A37
MTADPHRQAQRPAAVEQPDAPAIPTVGTQYNIGDHARVYAPGGDLYITHTSAMARATRTLPRDTAAFTGREEELRILTRAMEGAGAGRVVVIHTINGLAGVGKTALAVHAGHLLAEHFPDGQLFVDLHAHSLDSAPVAPADALDALLRADGLDAASIPEGVAQRAALWRDRLAGKQVLLVLDNAAGELQVEPLLPGAPGCLVLVTSRSRLAVSGAVPLTVESMSPEEGAALFARSAGRPVAEKDAAAVAELVALCEGLPLAIGIMAARYTNRPAWSVADLVQQMTEYDLMEELQEGDHSVAVAFELSYRDLPPALQHLMRLLGLYPAPDFDAHSVAALAGLPLAQTRRHLDALYTVSLIQETSRGRYRVHDLLARYARTLAQNSADTAGEAADAARERLLNHYLHAAYAAGRHFFRHVSTLSPPTDPPPAQVPQVTTREQARAWLEAERGNLHAVVQTAAAPHPAKAVALTATVADFMFVDGHWQQALTLHDIALTAARHIGDRHGQALARTNLGDVLWNSGDYGQAIDHYGRALELFTELDDRHGQATVLNDLGHVYWNEGRYGQAADHYGRALELFTELDNPRGQAIALNSLSLVYWGWGEFGRAVDHQTRALELFTELGDRRGQSISLINLGHVHWGRGEFGRAVDHQTRALELHIELGDRHAQALCLNNLGLAHRGRGEYEQATGYHLRALELFTELGDRLGQAYALNDLGEIHRVGKDLGRAADHHTRALEMLTELGDRRGQAQVFTCLGHMHRVREEFGPAADHHARALEVFTELGDRRGQAEALNDLGGLSALTSADEQAYTRYRQALDIARDIDVPLQEARALEGIGHCHLRQAPPGDGVAPLRQALDIYRRLDAVEARRVEETLSRHGS